MTAEGVLSHSAGAVSRVRGSYAIHGLIAHVADILLKLWLLITKLVFVRQFTVPGKTVSYCLRY